MVLLDDSVDINSPYAFAGVLHVTEAGAQFRAGRRLGGSGGLLDSAGGIDQIGLAFKLHRGAEEAGGWWQNRPAMA